jgi:hypothetical protein
MIGLDFFVNLAFGKMGGGDGSPSLLLVIRLSE